MRAGPGQALLQAETATVPPAFFRIAAAAGVILTGERYPVILARRSGHRHAEQGNQVSNEDQTGWQAVRQEMPEMSAPVPKHGKENPANAKVPPALKLYGLWVLGQGKAQNGMIHARL